MRQDKRYFMPVLQQNKISDGYDVMIVLSVRWIVGQSVCKYIKKCDVMQGI